MSDRHDPEFEDHLRTLFARAAEAIPADTDISARVRQSLVRAPHRALVRGPFGVRNALVIIAATLVVALLAGTLTFMRPGGPNGGATAKPTSVATVAPTPAITPLTCGNGGFAGVSGPANPPQPSGKPVDHSVVVGRHASLHGITITIDRVYADATQTVIGYHMYTNINPPLPALPVLIDAQGHRYGLTGGDWDISHGAYYAFTPLPAEELGAPQTLTFLAEQMQLASGTASGALVEGPWKITFDVTPVVGASAALNTAPVGGGLDGAAGGVRVVVRISGLSPDMRLADLYNFATAYNPVIGSSGCGPGILELALPNGQLMAPGFVYAPGQTVPTTPDGELPALAQTVGPNGTVDLEALFFLPIPSDASLTLYLDHLAAQVAGASKPHEISGPWEFQLRPIG